MFLTNIISERHPCEIFDSFVKVKIFWEGHKNFTLLSNDITRWEILSNFGTFSQYLNFRKILLSIDSNATLSILWPHRAKYLDTKLRYRSKLCKVIAFVLLLPWKQIILVKFVVVSTIYKLVYHVLKLIGYHDVLRYVQYCQCCQIRTNFINSG